MGRQINRLTAVGVQRITKSGYRLDGAGLYLQVRESGSKSWIFRYRKNGKLHDKGLGSIQALSLADAREAAAKCRKMLAGGIDPILAAKTHRDAVRLEKARRMTFSQCADAFIDSMRPQWKNEKHVAQWTNTIKTYATPIFGDIPVQDVDTALIRKALDPIWQTKNETASRLRGRLENILDWAKVSGLRVGDNPARWKGHLELLLPSPSKVQKTVHHPALPYPQTSSFIKQLRTQSGNAALALEFTILTAARTSETIGAKWAEFDLAAAIWTIPAIRMKMKKEHRVPLCSRAIEIIEKMKSLEADYVFPGGRKDMPLSNMAMAAVLKRMERTDITVHGFRSTFRDWAAETTAYPNEVVEMALAHRISNAVEAAYRRGDLMEKRKALMHAWQVYCERDQPAAIHKIAPTKKQAAIN